MSGKMRIVVDLDAVVADFFNPLFRRYELLTGEPVKMDQCTTWDTASHVGVPHLLNSIFREPGFFAKLPPLPGALEAIDELRAAGHEIAIATTPCTPHSAAEKYDWVGRYLPFIERRTHLYIGGDKSHIAGDVLIDDGPHNVIGWANTGRRAYGIAYPYNDVDAYYLRAHGHADPVGAWRQILDALRADIKD